MTLIFFRSSTTEPSSSKASATAPSTTTQASSSKAPVPALMDLDPEEGEDVSEADVAMMASMGFGGFGTTKGREVTGNQEGGVFIKKQRTWRQYMNRKGGFNRYTAASFRCEARIVTDGAHCVIGLSTRSSSLSSCRITLFSAIHYLFTSPGFMLLYPFFDSANPTPSFQISTQSREIQKNKVV